MALDSMTFRVMENVYSDYDLESGVPTADNPIIIECDSPYKIESVSVTKYQFGFYGEVHGYSFPEDHELFTNGRRTFTLPILDWNDYRIEAIAEKHEVPPAHEGLYEGVTNATVNMEIEDGYPKDDDQLVITADEGYEFGVVEVRHYIFGMITVNFDASDEQDSEYFSDDNTVFSFPASDYMIDERASFTTFMDSLSGGGGGDESTETLSYVDIFKIQPNQIQRLRNQKARGSDIEDSIDLSDYVYNMYVIPYEVDSALSEDNQPILLNGHDTELYARRFEQNVLVVDLGTIEVPNKYNNSYDYDNTECRLHLPYLPATSLVPQEVIGCDIDISYRCELITRKATVLVRSTFNGQIISSNTFEFGDVVPFKERHIDSVESTTSLTVQMSNGIDTPVLEVIRNIPAGAESDFGTVSNNFDILNNQVGYLEVENVILDKFVAPEIIKDRIEYLLKSGVVIRQD